MLKNTFKQSFPRDHRELIIVPVNKKIQTSEDLIKSKHSCILPWIHSHILPDSTVLPCCVSDFSESYGQLNQKSMDEIWNDEKFNQMRLRMLEDKPVKSCHNCYELEAGNMSSMRQRMNKEFSHHVKDLHQTAPDGSYSQIKMRYLDIRFSNLCNFKCRGCSPFCSSQWFDDYRELWGQNINDQKLVSLNQTEKTKIGQLNEWLETLEVAYFAGGEPLMMDEHYYCLERLIELNKDIPIHYNSNLSVLRFKKYDLIELWKNFSQIDLNISLDDFGPRGEYFRHGLEWEKFKKNVLKIKEELPHARFQVTCTITIFNIHRIPEIHDEIMQLGIIDSSGFTLNPLQDPVYYRTQVLPKNEKTLITNKLSEFKESLPKRYPGQSWDDFQASIDGIVSVMNKIDLSSELSNFKKVTKKLDQLRDESFQETFPEMAHLMTNRFLIFVPLRNQENRIQPLMRAIEKEILPASSLIFFVDEASQDQTQHVLGLELPELSVEHKIVKLNQNKGRGFSFKIAEDYARERDIDFILTIEEGWEDCIDEFRKIIKNKEFYAVDMLIGRRSATRNNLGKLIEIISNKLTSFITRKNVKETKGDGINLIKISDTDNKTSFLNTFSNEDYFYPILLNHLANNKDVRFSAIDNGINFKTQINLNLKRLFFVTTLLSKYVLKKLTNQSV